MKADRRRFLKYSAAAGLAAGASACSNEWIEEQADNPVPPSIRALKPMTDGIVPITLDERRARIEKAQRLMAENRSTPSSSRAARACSISPACAGAERAAVCRRHSARASSPGSAPLRRGAGA